MGAVHIGIRHDDDLVVAELVDVEILAQSRAEGNDDGLELGVAVDVYKRQTLPISVSST